MEVSTTDPAIDPEETAEQKALQEFREALDEFRQPSWSSPSVTSPTSSTRSPRKSFLVVAGVLLAVTLVVIFGVSASNNAGHNKDSVRSPSASSSSPHNTESNDPSCDWDCQTDRHGNNQLMYSGQGICNEQYRFGISRDGVFQFQDCDAKERLVILNITEQQDSKATKKQNRQI